MSENLQPIPLLSRKWDLVDCSMVSKYERAKPIHAKVLELHALGKSPKEISKEIGFSYGAVYNVIKRKATNNVTKN